MTSQLSEEEYKSTMTNKMVNVTETAEPIVDIWVYIEKLVADRIVDEYTFKNQLIESVYRNQSNSYDHILLPTPNENRFVVIIVDLINSKIKGHYPLDLNKEYGLTKN